MVARSTKAALAVCTLALCLIAVRCAAASREDQLLVINPEAAAAVSPQDAVRVQAVRLRGLSGIVNDDDDNSPPEPPGVEDDED